MTGSDDGSVRFWEVSTGRCMKSITMETGSLGNMCIRSVAWNPHPDVSLVAIAMYLTFDHYVFIQIKISESMN